MRRLWGLGLFLVLNLGASAGALPVTFRKIADDTSTPIPGGSGNFTGLGNSPALENGRVVFVGVGAGNADWGLYEERGSGLDVLYNTSTPIPGGTGTFREYSDAAVAGDGVAFFANANPQKGIYTDLGGSLVAVADQNTPIPGGSGTFTAFDGSLGLDGNEVAFNGHGSGGQDGIYLGSGGALTTVIDQSTPIPGGSGNFGNVSDPLLDAGSIAFLGGGGGGAGVYTDAPGSLTAVADLNTPIPGGTGNFVQISPSLSFSDGSVAFLGLGSSDQRGIYSGDGGPLSIVADTNTVIPGRADTFGSFSLVSLDGDHVAFHGLSSESGIYTNVTGSLEKIIEEGDLFDGKTVLGMNISDQALHGNEIVFWVVFEERNPDGVFAEGIYVATIPEPGTAALLGLGILALGSRGRPDRTRHAMRARQAAENRVGAQARFRGR